MNRKFIALLIPLMLLPMVSFGAAHWYDYVTKQYKLKVGALCMEVTYWHVTRTTSHDVNCNGEVFGDELVITNIYGKNPCDGNEKVAGVRIYANPIFPSWELEFEMIIHNKGQLVVQMDVPIFVFSGPHDTDPGWGLPTDDVWPKYFYYDWVVFVWEEGVGWVKTEPDMVNLKPSESVRILQYIHFIGQEYPELQCHWFRIDVTYPFFEFVPKPISSYTYEKPPGPAPTP